MNTPDKTRISDYVRIKAIRSQVLARITGGKLAVYVNEKWISEKEFDKLYPPELRPLSKSLENPDKTKVL